VRPAEHCVGSPVPLFAAQGPRFPYPCVVCVLARQHQHLFLLRLRTVRLRMCAPVACPVPTAMPNLPAVAHGRPIPREMKNANFLAPTHEHLPKFLHVKPSLEHPKNWRQSPLLFPSYK